MNNHKIKILLIDDDPEFGELIRMKFRKKIEENLYSLSIAQNSMEGLMMTQNNHFDIILIDINLPDMNGLILHGKIKEIDPEAKAIIVSADAQMKNIRTAMNNEAFDFILKPVDFQDLEATIKKTVHQIEHEHEIQDELQKAFEKLQETMIQIVESISTIEEMRDPYTSGHMKRVGQLAYRIAQELGYPKDKCTGIMIASLLHDIGKIVIPSEILTKPGGLSEHEFSLVQDHAQAGYRILKRIEFPWPIADYVHQHHERLDGSGYPQGLKEDKILIESQIIAVSDVVEAVASYRPYRPALGIDEALRVIKEQRGIQLNDQIVDIACNLIEHKGFEFEGSSGSKAPPLETASNEKSRS